MEDPSSAISQTVAPTTRGQLPEPEQHLKCPRCESINTKFCYYNNYNLSQPRHFCKDCRRYWTKGGTLRNIPVGGGTRRASTRRSSLSSSPSTAANDNSASCGVKRPSTSPTSSPSSNSAKRVLKPEPIPGTYPSPAEARDHLLELSGPISPLLTANGMFGELLFNVSHPGGPSAAARTIPESGFMGWELFHPLPPAPQQQQQSQTSGDDCNGSEGVAPVVENFLGLVGDSSCWSNISNGGDGWTDLAIYAPGSNFQ